MISANLSTEITQSLQKMGLAAPDEEPAYVPLAGGVSSDIWRVDLQRGSVCVKRALPKLRVQMDWYAPVERNQYEIAWLRTVAQIEPAGVPKILGTDAIHGLFAMEYLPPETYRLWRTELFAGRADSGIAAEVGRLLTRIHAATANRADIGKMFPTGGIFHGIRLEPYLEATGRRHPDLAGRLHRLVETTAGTTLALVHGDISPKNIFLGPAGPVFLDAECAWYGDPAFDLAFCLNHMLLKCLWTPGSTRDYLACFDSMHDAYVAGVKWESPEDLELRASALLPALFLARVDGKSPVDYITRGEDKERVRRIGRLMIQSAPRRLSVIRQAWAEEMRVGE